MLLKVGWDKEKNRKTSCDFCAIHCERFFAFLGWVQKILAGKKKRLNESYEWTEAYYLIQTGIIELPLVRALSTHRGPGYAITLAMKELQSRETSKRSRTTCRNRLHLTERQKVVYMIINIIQQARRSGHTKKPPQVFISLVNRRWKWNIALDMFTEWEKEARTEHSRNTNWNIIHAFVVLLLLVNLAPIPIS